MKVAIELSQRILYKPVTKIKTVDQKRKEMLINLMLDLEVLPIDMSEIKNKVRSELLQRVWLDNIQTSPVKKLVQ